MRGCERLRQFRRRAFKLLRMTVENLNTDAGALIRLTPPKRGSTPTALTVTGLTGLSASSIRCLVKRGEFPAPRAVGARSIRWRLSDVRDWLASRPVATTSKEALWA